MGALNRELVGRGDKGQASEPGNSKRVLRHLPPWRCRVLRALSSFCSGVPEGGARRKRTQLSKASNSDGVFWPVGSADWRAVPVFDAAWAQPNSLQRQATQRRNSPQWTLIPAVQASPAASSVLDTTSLLGQALAACDKGAAVQDVFALPGLKAT